jgi:hypothetical protein
MTEMKNPKELDLKMKNPNNQIVEDTDPIIWQGILRTTTIKAESPKEECQP